MASLDWSKISWANRPTVSVETNDVRFGSPDHACNSAMDLRFARIPSQTVNGAAPRSKIGKQKARLAAGSIHTPTAIIRGRSRLAFRQVKGDSMPDPSYKRPSASVKLHATSVQPTYWPEESGLPTCATVPDSRNSCKRSR